MGPRIAETNRNTGLDWSRSGLGLVCLTTTSTRPSFTCPQNQFSILFNYCRVGDTKLGLWGNAVVDTGRLIGVARFIGSPSCGMWVARIEPALGNDLRARASPLKLNSTQVAINLKQFSSTRFPGNQSRSFELLSYLLYTRILSHHQPPATSALWLGFSFSSPGTRQRVNQLICLFEYVNSPDVCRYLNCGGLGGFSINGRRSSSVACSV